MHNPNNSQAAGRQRLLAAALYVLGGVLRLLAALQH